MYHNFFQILTAAVFCLWQMQMQAQVDTVLALPEVSVMESHLRSNASERTERWDSTELQPFSHTHIGELLEQQSGVFVKNYGPGSIATLSTRGSSAGHTLVTWNGLPIQSPMLGLLDVSLLPTAFADEASLSLGGNSSLWGSGAIGGVLALENRPIESTPLRVQAQSAIGSFGRFDNQLKFELSRGKWGSSSTLLRQHADNDFPYLIANGKTEKTLTNSAREQLGLLQEFYWKPKENQQLAIHFWWQNSYREIPPTTVQTRSEATQEDDIFRTALHWKRMGKHSVWQARLGFFHEEIDFQDPQILLSAVSHFWTGVGEVEGQLLLAEGLKMTVGVNQMVTRAFADEYESPPTESQTAVFASLRQNLEKTTLQLAVRQSIVDGELLGLTPSLSLRQDVNDYLHLRGKLSRNYRLPTMNDRFWRPGGNPELSPEIGWSQELGLVTEKSEGQHRFRYEATVYNRNIQDWILWSPKNGEPFWSANNLAEVWSRGIEQRLSWHWHLPKAKIKLTGGHDFTRSTNERAIEQPKIKAGEQLIYVPRHQFFGRFAFEVRSWQLAYRHRYSGSVRTTTEPLEGYYLGSIRADWKFQRNPVRVRVFCQIRNVWNASYRVVERRPMPGRNWQIGFRLNFEKQK